MWTIFYNSREQAKYKIILYFEYYYKLSGALYFIQIENWNGKCMIGQPGDNYEVNYLSGPWDWDSYFGKVRSLGWGDDVRNGLSDTDPRVKKIINDPNIKLLLNEMLKKYSKNIIHDIFERFHP